MDLGGANTAFGHGYTQLAFGDVVLCFSPGANEDDIVVSSSSCDWSKLDPAHWTVVDIDDRLPIGHRLNRITVYSDETNLDVGVMFAFDSGRTFSVVLCDTDLMIGINMEMFAFARNPVSFHVRVQMDA